MSATAFVSSALRRSTAATLRASLIPSFAAASSSVSPAVSRAHANISGITVGILCILARNRVPGRPPPTEIDPSSTIVAQARASCRARI